MDKWKGYLWKLIMIEKEIMEIKENTKNIRDMKKILMTLYIKKEINNIWEEIIKKEEVMIINNKIKKFLILLKFLGILHHV